jgi:hypothetical protein
MSTVFDGMLYNLFTRRDEHGFQHERYTSGLGSVLLTLCPMVYWAAAPSDDGVQVVQAIQRSTGKVITVYRGGKVWIKVSNLPLTEG